MRRLQIIVSAMVALVAADHAAAIAIDQFDTFEDGTTQGWEARNFFLEPSDLPAINNLGGPAGGDDRYMLLSSTALTGSAVLSASNSTQWTGDFIAAGITAISMDVNNFFFWA
jgi:hypothetical protein